MTWIERTGGGVGAGLGLAFLLAVTLATAAGAVTVDDLADSQGPLSTGGTAASSAAAGAGTILGGERDMEVSLVSGTGPVTADVGNTTTSVLTFGSPAGTDGSLEVQWDGADAAAALDPVGLGGADLTAGGDSALSVPVDSATAGAVLTIEVHTSATQYSFFRRVLPAIAGPTSLSIAYAEFAGNADFTNVGAVVLRLEGNGATVALGAPIATGVATAAVVATKVDAVLDSVTGDADGVADPGETVEYTVELTSIASGVTGANLSDTVDANSTFVAGSLDTTPLARDDSYACLGNVGLDVPAASGVLANDCDPDAATGSTTCDSGVGLGAPPIVAFDATTAQGGTVTMPAVPDGSFTYDPPAGFVGIDLFGYTIGDGEGNADAATVAITCGEMIWFVDNSVAGPGTGRLTDPFDTFVSLDGAAGSGDADAAGQCIFVHSGSGSYGGGLELENGQRLVGQGTTLALDAACSLTLPPHSRALPATAGARPILVNSSTSPGEHAIVLAQDNIVRGLDLGSTAAQNTRISGGAAGTLTIDEVAVAGDGRVISLTGAAGGSSLTFDSISSTGSSGAAGIALSGFGGSFTVSNPGAGTDTSIAGAGGRGISVQSSGGATFSFGETGVASSAAGIDLGSGGANPMASFTFDSLSVTTTAGAGLIANQSGTVTIGGTGNTITAAGGPAVDVTGGTNLGTGWTFATLSSSGSPGDGINLDNVGGSAGLTAADGAITTPAGIAVDINQLPVPFRYDGTIVNNAGRSVEVTNSGGAAPNVIAFGGAIDDNGTGIFLDNNDQGAGATVSFTGGLALDTGSSQGFTATNGGTVNVTGTNTIGAASPLTARAVQIANTTIGASGVTFRSIDVNGAATAIDLNATGAVGGFSITGIDGPCGAAGSSDCDGGTIRNTSADAILLNDTDDVSLSFVEITNIGNMAGASDTLSGHDGIDATDVDGLTLANLDASQFSDSALKALRLSNLLIRDSAFADANRYHLAGIADGTGSAEGTLFLRELGGTNSITNSTFVDGAEHIDIENGLVDLTLLTVQGNTIDTTWKNLGGPSFRGKIGLDVVIKGAANATVHIGDPAEASPALGNTFVDARIASLRITHFDFSATGRIDAIISRNVFDVRETAPSFQFATSGDQPQGGVALVTRGTPAARLNAILSHNSFDFTQNADGRVGSLSLLFDGPGSGLLGGVGQVRVNNNTFNFPYGAAIEVADDGTTRGVALFDNNTITGGLVPAGLPFAGFPAPALPIEIFDQGVNGTLHTVWMNMSIPEHDTGFAPGSALNFTKNNAGTLCTAISNVTALDNISPPSPSGGFDFNQFAGMLQLEQGASAVNTPLAVVIANNGNVGSVTNPNGTVTVVGPQNTQVCDRPAGGIFP